jgi:hypothetical protein
VFICGFNFFANRHFEDKTTPAAFARLIAQISAVCARDLRASVSKARTLDAAA